jgi:hypothetical protein
VTALRYGEPLNWINGDVAKDGGTATIRIAHYEKTLFYQDLQGLTLSGIDFRDSLFTMIGNDITMTGERSFITASRPNNETLTFAVGFKGNGSNILVKDGIFKVNFAVPVSNFSEFHFIDGIIVATNSTGRIVADTPIKFSKRIDVVPLKAQNGHAELALGNGQVTALGDAAAIRVRR